MEELAVDDDIELNQIDETMNKGSIILEGYEFQTYDFDKHNICKIEEGQYTGEFIDGLRYGKGRCEWSDKSYYDGNWENGKRQCNG